jgi:hypothetical protein
VEADGRSVAGCGVVVVEGGDSELDVGGFVSTGTTGTVWVSVVVAGACAAGLAAGTTSAPRRSAPRRRWGRARRARISSRAGS